MLDRREEDELEKYGFWKRWTVILQKKWFIVIAAAVAAGAATASLSDAILYVRNLIFAIECDFNVSMQEYIECERQNNGSLINLVGSAYAQTAEVTDGIGGGAEFEVILKQGIIGGIFIVVVIFFLWCLWAISFSKKTKTISFSFESLKLLAGFFVGALTGFLGFD